MTLSALRSLLYLIARLLGDVNAVRRGTIDKRLTVLHCSAYRHQAARFTGIKWPG